MEVGWELKDSISQLSLQRPLEIQKKWQRARQLSQPVPARLSGCSRGAPTGAESCQKLDYYGRSRLDLAIGPVDRGATIMLSQLTQRKLNI